MRPQLTADYGVAASYVFGSVAREESACTSDVDLLVEFQGPATFAKFMDLKALLEDTLGAPVDLVTRAGLRERPRTRRRPDVSRDASLYVDDMIEMGKQVLRPCRPEAEGLS